MRMAPKGELSEVVKPGTSWLPVHVTLSNFTW